MSQNQWVALAEFDVAGSDSLGTTDLGTPVLYRFGTVCSRSVFAGETLSPNLQAAT